jgi:phosphopantothenoylcysteine synthetase/decarboxylase
MLQEGISNIIHCLFLFSYMIDAQDEWKGWQKMNDPVLHIQLRDWADVAILAPLSAHTLAKIATGLCDDTLTCVLRAWDFGHTGKKNDKSRSSSGGKPLVLAPAMNTAMWEHPLTRLQLETIQGFWKKNGGLATTTSLDGRRSSSNHGLIRIAEPQIKTLACGEVGNGAMASVECIVKIVQDVLRMGTSIDTGISNVQK